MFWPVDTRCTPRCTAHVRAPYTTGSAVDYRPATMPLSRGGRPTERAPDGRGVARIVRPVVPAWLCRRRRPRRDCAGGPGNTRRWTSVFIRASSRDGEDGAAASQHRKALKCACPQRRQRAENRERFVSANAVANPARVATNSGELPRGSHRAGGLCLWDVSSDNHDVIAADWPRHRHQIFSRSRCVSRRPLDTWQQRCA